MPVFQFTQPPWYAGASNRRYGMTRGIYAGSGQDRLELGRMNIGSPEYEANFSLVLAAPQLLKALQELLEFVETDERDHEPWAYEAIREDVTDRAITAIKSATTITGGQS